MPPELKPSARWLSYFTNETAACDYCGNVPTMEVTVTPPIVRSNRVISKPIRASLCWECCRRLQLHPMTNPSAADKIAWRKYVLAERRREQRQTMKLGQTQLFDPNPGPGNAITEG